MASKVGATDGKLEGSGQEFTEQYMNFLYLLQVLCLVHLHYDHSFLPCLVNTFELGHHFAPSTAQRY